MNDAMSFFAVGFDFVRDVIGEWFYPFLIILSVAAFLLLATHLRGFLK